MNFQILVFEIIKLGIPIKLRKLKKNSRCYYTTCTPFHL